MRWAALAVYAVVVGAVFTPLYDPLESGDDQTWAILLALAAAHVGAGAALRTARALLLPLPVALVGIVTSDYPLATAAAVVGPMVGVMLIAVGWGVASLAGRVRAGAGTLAVGAFVPALVIWAAAATETVDRLDSPRAPRSLEAQLPTDDDGLAAVCDPEAPPEDERRARAKTDALLRELRHRPDTLVTYTYEFSDEPDETREITVRELVEEQLNDFEDGLSPRCPEVERRLREALDRD